MRKGEAMKKAISKISVTAMTAFCLMGCSDTPEADGPVKEKAAAAVSETFKDAEPKAEVKPTPVSETRSADSHTHGDASLALVLENGRVTAEFETPLFNLLGFEHAANTNAQKDAVSKAEANLSRPAEMIVFNREARCMAAETALVKLGPRDDEEHDHDHEDHDEDHSDHKDVLLSYQFTCKNADALKNVTVNLFEYFENLTTLDLVYLGPNTQKQMRLSASNTGASLTR